MKLPVLAVLGAALLLSACAKKEAEACASPDVKDQLMRIFLQGAITERSPEFKDSALRDVAILEKDPDSGVLSCVGTSACRPASRWSRASCNIASPRWPSPTTTTCCWIPPAPTPPPWRSA